MGPCRLLGLLKGHADVEGKRNDKLTGLGIGLLELRALLCSSFSQKTFAAFVILSSYFRYKLYVTLLDWKPGIKSLSRVVSTMNS